MKKKILITLLASLALSACAAGFAACGDKQAQPAEGQVIPIQSAYATAAELGYTGTAAEFSAQVNGNIKSVERNDAGELIVTYVDGTVLNLGKVEITCVHNYSDWATEVAPSCTAAGLNSRVCSKCGDTEYTTVEATGHQAAEYSHNRSCHEFNCEVCGYIQEEHKFVNNVCTVCGYTADYSLWLEYEFDAESKSYTVIRNVKYINATEIIVPEIYKNYPVTAIGTTAFTSCKEVKKIVLPDSINKISMSAFMGCSKLAEINIPDGVTEIENNTFVACNSLTELVLPESITKIGNNAFRLCSNLTQINIPETVTEIGTGAFAYCYALESITLPQGLTRIENSTFIACKALTEVVIPDGVTYLSGFAKCESLVSVTIPASVTEIGLSAFEMCSSLESVELPENLTAVGERAFADCTSLESINIPASVTEIGSNAFTGCVSLTKITLGEGITQLGANLFSGCTSLTEIVLPASLTKISAGALLNCDKVTEIIFNGTAEQWKAIKKASGWKTKDNIMKGLTVKCSDGDLEYIW